MAPIAISSPPSPTLDNISGLTKVATRDAIQKELSHGTSPQARLDASQLKIHRNSSPKPMISPDDPAIASSKLTTDHMLTARWTEEAGWEAPEIGPYGPLSIMPTASVLHYATECFEGMKVYRGHDGKLRIFRPMRNAQRLLKSATRIALPAFDPEEFLKCLKRFLGFEMTKWLPNTEEWRGKFVYLRPTMIATAPALGVQKPKEALLYVIAVFMPIMDEPKPSAALSSTTNDQSNGEQKKPQTLAKGMKLLASQHDTIRAWPGGFGYAKVGANYGPTLVAQGEARARGYDQVLWLFGEENYVTEAGGSNLFVLWRTKSDPSRLELVTAPLDDQIILEGVTRASVLEIVREKHPEISVVERRFTMAEMEEACRDGRLLEAFGSGTAFFIAPVSDIHFRGKDLVLPLGEGTQPDFALKVKDELKSIMYGGIQHEWGVIVEEKTQ